MTLDRSRLNWGVFLIVLGGIPLAYNQGAITADTVHDLWRLWPLVLIGLGLGLVLSRTPLAFMGGLTVAACLGLVLGSLLAVGPQVGCGNDPGPTHAFSRTGTFDGTGASAKLELQCGSARVSASSDSSWRLDGSIQSKDPSIVASGRSLTISQLHRGDWSINRGRDEWNVALPADVSNLSASLDAGDASFSLSGLTLQSASFSANAGSLEVDMGSATVDQLTLSNNVGSSKITLGTSSLSGSISNNVGSVEVCAPAGLGVSVRYSGNLASDNFSAAGMALVNGTWQTPGFEAAASKAALVIDNSVGSVTLRLAGGC